MLVALALAVAVPQPLNKVADRYKYEIPTDVFYLADLPSGSGFCDKAQARRQRAAFDKRYGARFNRLVEVAKSREEGKSPKELGWDPDDIIVGSCHRITGAHARRLLNDFDTTLIVYEKRYGLASRVR
jgi:hypothetical protein